MSSYQTNPPIHVGECVCCGRVQEDAICEDCTEVMEARNSAILDFYGNLPADLQRAFDPSEGLFDSGHSVTYIGGTYRLANPEGETLRTFVDSNEFTDKLPISEVIWWCVQHRGVLI